MHGYILILASTTTPPHPLDPDRERAENWLRR